MIVQRATLHPHSQGTARAPGAEMLSATEVLKYGNNSPKARRAAYKDKSNWC